MSATEVGSIPGEPCEGCGHEVVSIRPPGARPWLAHVLWTRDRGHRFPPHTPAVCRALKRGDGAEALRLLAAKHQ